MHKDRIGGFGQVLGTEQTPRLNSLLGVGQCILKGHLGQTQGLHAHANACGIHHDKHRGQTPVGLAHQSPDRPFKAHLTSRTALDAHLVLKRCTKNTISCPQCAIGFKKKLGYEKQADALAAFGRIRQARQDQMHDVVHQIMLTRADEYFLTCQCIRPVVLRQGLGGDQAQIRSTLRLGQTHGAAPLTAGEFGQKGFLLPFIAMRMQALVSPMGQARIHGPGLVGCIEHFINALVHHHR